MEPVIDPDVDATWAHHLLDIARSHVAKSPILHQRVGPSEVREGVSWSLTAMVVTDRHLAVAEVAVRGNESKPIVVQVFKRHDVKEVFACEKAVYALVDVAAVDSSLYGFRVEGPVISLPTGTLASEVLL